MRGDDIADRLLSVAIRVLRLARELPKDKPGQHIAGQLLRSGTAPGANYDEARGAESRADFIHKLKIAEKEMRETHYWLRLIAAADWEVEADLAPLIDEAHQLVSILHASAITARAKNGKRA